jgi:hypothetical protein
LPSRVGIAVQGTTHIGNNRYDDLVKSSIPIL